MSGKLKLPSISKKDRGALLSSNQSIARLASVDPNGNPHVVPVWFLYTKRKVWIPTPLRSLKVKNVKARPTVSLVIDSYAGGLKARGILFKGRASIISGGESSKINHKIHEKYMGEELNSQKWIDQEDDGTIVVSPSIIRTWDSSNVSH